LKAWRQTGEAVAHPVAQTVAQTVSQPGPDVGWVLVGQIIASVPQVQSAAEELSRTLENVA